MLFRQVRHGPANPQGVLGQLRRMIGRRRQARRLIETIGCGSSGGVLLSPSFQKPVAQNSVEPAGESATAIEACHGLPRGDQRLLHEVLGPLAIPAQGERTAPEARRDLFGQSLKGNRLPGPGTVDQLALVVCGRVHSTGDSPVRAKRFTGENIFVGIRAVRTPRVAMTRWTSIVRTFSPSGRPFVAPSRLEKPRKNPNRDALRPIVRTFSISILSRPLSQSAFRTQAQGSPPSQGGAGGSFRRPRARDRGLPNSA